MTLESNLKTNVSDFLQASSHTTLLLRCCFVGRSLNICNYNTWAASISCTPQTMLGQLGSSQLAYHLANEINQGPYYVKSITNFLQNSWHPGKWAVFFMFIIIFCGFIWRFKTVRNYFWKNIIRPNQPYIASFRAHFEQSK